jgi:hypothetical protein
LGRLIGSKEKLGLEAKVGAISAFLAGFDRLACASFINGHLLVPPTNWILLAELALS